MEKNDNVEKNDDSEIDSEGYESDDESEEGDTLYGVDRFFMKEFIRVTKYSKEDMLLHINHLDLHDELCTNIRNAISKRYTKKHPDTRPTWGMFEQPEIVQIRTEIKEKIRNHFLRDCNRELQDEVQLEQRAHGEDGDYVNDGFVVPDGDETNDEGFNDFGLLDYIESIDRCNKKIANLQKK